MNNQQSTGNSEKSLDLGKHGTAIVDKDTGNEVYEEIKFILKSSDDVSVNFENIVTMATFCAKQIFGRLYIELGSEDFFKKIKMINASQELRYIITTGIKEALKDQKSK